MKDLTRDEIITHAVEIASEYDGNLTVRQLYYQFVSRGLTGSGQKVYRRVGEAVAAARMKGTMPFDWIVDRGRSCAQSDCIDNEVDVDDALEHAESWIGSMPNWAIKRARWYGQRVHVTVGVEKEALSGVFEDTCRQLGVSMFAFKGYASLSSLHEWAKNLDEAYNESDTIEEAVLLYFGDHDPDGWEIPRSALRNVEQIADVDGLSIPYVRLERVALNMDQIERYNPPPFEAKITSSRCAHYVREHDTDEAWELDALRPDVLQQLIRDAVSQQFDARIYVDNERLVRKKREQVREIMKSHEWISRVLGDS